jgi:ADP-ribose pyrophosphatase
MIKKENNVASMRDAKLLKTEVLGNKYKRIVRDYLRMPDGKEMDWIYLDKPKSLAIVALTPQQEVVLVDLYRYTRKEQLRELPAGEMDSTDSSSLAAAQRELREETGYVSDHFVDLGEYYVLPSETNRAVHFYLALDATQVETPKMDNLVEKYFNMSLHTVPLETLSIPQTAAKLRISGLETLFGIQLAQQYLRSTPVPTLP